MRDQWSPSLLRVYRLRPWEMARFTGGELDALGRDLRQLNREARKQGR